MVVAPRAGIEPAIGRLTAACLSTWLPRNGSGGEDRTLIRGFRDHCSTVELLPNGGSGESRTRFFPGKNRVQFLICFGSVVVGPEGVEPSLQCLKGTYPAIRSWSRH